MNRWHLSEDNEELIHRVFGGTIIIIDSVRTEAELDFYNTQYSNQLVIITRTHAYFKRLFSTASFEWDEPLHEKI